MRIPLLRLQKEPLLASSFIELRVGIPRPQHCASGKDLLVARMCAASNCCVGHTHAGDRIASFTMLNICDACWQCGSSESKRHRLQPTRGIRESGGDVSGCHLYNTRALFIDFTTRAQSPSSLIPSTFSVLLLAPKAEGPKTSVQGSISGVVIHHHHFFLIHFYKRVFLLFRLPPHPLTPSLPLPPCLTTCLSFCLPPRPSFLPPPSSLSVSLFLFVTLSDKVLVKVPNQTKRTSHFLLLPHLLSSSPPPPPPVSSTLCSPTPQSHTVPSKGRRPRTLFS